MTTSQAQQNQQQGQEDATFRRLITRFNRFGVRRLARLLKIQSGENILSLLLLVAVEDLIAAVTPAEPPEHRIEFVNATALGQTEVVERVEGKKIRVLSYTLNNGAGSSATVHFRSGSRPISADKILAATGGGVVAPIGRGFWFETAIGEALNINLAAAGTIGVDVVYVEQPGLRGS